MMDQKDYQRRRLVEWLVAEITRATGRRYRIQLEALDDESLRVISDHTARWSVRRMCVRRRA